MITRRKLLSRAAASGGICALVGAAPRWLLRLGNQIPEQAAHRLSRTAKFERIGLALYTVRNLAARDFEGTLRTVADIGYRDLDMYPDVGRLPPKETRALLDRFGLRCRSARIATSALQGDLPHAIEAANVLGAKWLTLASVPAQERTSLGDWERLVASIARASEVARRGGLTFCYHNHDFEFQPLEGRLPLEILLDRTDPDLVRMQMDVYWVTKGGRDPGAEIRRLSGRVATLHLKDMDATPARGITTVGRGIIDFAAVLRVALEAKVSDVFVEEDDPADPIAAARASHEHLTRLSY